MLLGTAMAIVLAQPLQVDVEAKGWESEGVLELL
jgi:hypothetical protein